MKANFANCLAFTLTYEGGYSSNRKDPGNWTGGKVGVGTLKGTKYGIAAHSYPNLDIKNLTLDDVKPIYEKNYWRPIQGDSLPLGIDLATFDSGVMSGPARGAKWLQAALGVKQDGIVGANTLAKARVSDARDIVKKVCAKRTGFVQSLKTFVTFGKGWTARIAACEAQALKMVVATASTAAAATSVLKKEAKAAATKAKQQATGAAATGASGTGSYAVSDQLAHWITAGVIVGAIALVVYLVWRSHVNKTRADAFTAEAAA